jgi:ResB-like family
MSTFTISRTILAHFGSLRSTLVCMAMLAATVAAGQAQGQLANGALGAVLAALGINLLAALWVHPAFRRQLPLLVFHLALLALLVLLALGRMTALDGRFELTQGVGFDGTLIESSAGRWHRDGLARLALRHEGFDIDYAPGRRRGATRNRVIWHDANGVTQETVIGDHRPLVVNGYRFYTSSNKGFAPLLTWRPLGGESVTGAVHLPSFPVHELRQSREWSLPDGRSLWVMLQFDETLIDPNSRANFRLPDSHRLVLRMDTRRVELAPGDRVELDGGTLIYDGLRTWMGYRVSYDWTLPWLLAASLLAAFALAWHYTQRFFVSARSPTGRRVGLAARKEIGDA